LNLNGFSFESRRKRGVFILREVPAPNEADEAYTRSLNTVERLAPVGTL